MSPSRHYIEYGDGFVEDYDLVADPYELTALNIPDPAVGALLSQARQCAGAACP